MIAQIKHKECMWNKKNHAWSKYHRYLLVCDSSYVFPSTCWGKRRWTTVPPQWNLKSHVKCQQKDCIKRGVKKKSIKSRNTSHKESFSRASTYVIVIPRNFSCIFVMNNNACYALQQLSAATVYSTSAVVVIAGWLKAS